VPDDDAQPVRERPSEIEDLTGLLAGLLRHPDGGDGTKEREQGGRGRGGDALAQGVLEEAGVRLERRAEQGLGRDEEDHELGAAGQVRVVRAGRESVDVGAERPRVVGEELLPAVRGVPAGGRIDRRRLEIGVHRDLRVDRDGALTG
jgi:hypothetical protein